MENENYMEITLDNSEVKKWKLSVKTNYEKILFYIVTGLFLIYTIFPVISVVLFSVSGKWNMTLLPEVWSLSAYRELFMNSLFWSSFARSFLVSFLVVLMDILIITAALLGVELSGNKKMMTLLETISIIPVALPGVVLALSTVTFYGEAFPLLLGSPVLLVFSEAVFAFPFMLWSLKNTFMSINAGVLYDASCTLGVPTWKFILKILVPSLKKGMLTGGIMVFTTTFNNFALAQLIVGSGWETYQVFLNKLMRIDGHMASAMVLTGTAMTFILVAVCSLTGKILKNQ